MADTLTAAPPHPPADRWWKAIAVAVGLVGLIVVAGGSWLLRSGQPRAHEQVEGELLALLAPARVPPYLALWMLADYPPEQLWQEPLQQQPEGAMAMWLFGPVVPDHEAISALQRLAGAQAPTDPDRAAAYLLAAADVTRLSPDLSDRERADALVAIGKELEGLGLNALAVTEWRQASILAHYSPVLPTLYRRTLLHDLSVLYDRVGASRLAAQARQQVSQVSSSESVAAPERVLLDTGILPDEPAALQAAREQRRLAAQQAARALHSSDEEQAYADLRAALETERLLHRQWMGAQLAAAPAPEVQAALLLYQIRWLQRERMLAWGVGGPAFAGWAERRPDIELALHEAWGALESVRVAQSIRAGDQQRATLAQRDWWATRLVQARLGRDPALAQPSLVGAMRPNNADGAGDTALRLDWIQERFWRVPREYVGTDTLPE